MVERDLLHGIARRRRAAAWNQRHERMLPRRQQRFQPASENFSFFSHGNFPLPIITSYAVILRTGGASSAAESKDP